MKRFAQMLLSVLLLCAMWADSALAFQPDEAYTYHEEVAVPSANVFQVSCVIDANVMGTTALNTPQDIFVDGKDYTYILDSGNRRVLVLDTAYRCVHELSEFTYQGETLTLANGAQGLFFQDSTQLLYIADTANDRILVTDLQGNVTNIYVQPESELLDASIKFAPRKIIVDNMGLMYVTTVNINTGALLIDSDNQFLGFYGTNTIKETLEIKIEYMWRSIMTDEQNAQSQFSFQPAEFNNIFWSEDRFVYVVSPIKDSVATPVAKLNALGKNVFPDNVEFGDIGMMTDAENKPVFADITVDDEGVFTLLDLSRGRLFQYDDNCNLLAVFGGMGNQNGLFSSPVSIESDSQNRILVLDAGKNNVTVLEQTYYGKLIREATVLHNQGRYADALEPWLEVIKMNANFILAYEGMGKAYMKLGEYELAKQYFEMADDQEGYSEARDALRSEWLRKNFVLVALLVILAMVFTLSSDLIKALARKAIHKFMPRKGVKAS